MFITFEGIDGSGKSTQAQLLQNHLQQQGHSVLLVREPGGVPLAERIRDILLSDDAPISPFAELLLFSAARAQLVQEKIKPALDTGKTVICDRFYDSTTAYQGAGRGVADLSWLAEFHLEVTGGLVPDITFLVDVPLDVAKSRRDDRTENEDRMEAGGDTFFQKIRDAYLELAAQNPTRFRVLDGTGSPMSIHAQTVDAVSTLNPSY